MFTVSQGNSGFFGSFAPNPLSQDVYKRQTKGSIQNYFAVLQKFNELGFSFDEADEALINQEVENYWSESKDSYEETGVSKDSCLLYTSRCV